MRSEYPIQLSVWRFGLNKAMKSNRDGTLTPFRRGDAFLVESIKVLASATNRVLVRVEAADSIWLTEDPRRHLPLLVSRKTSELAQLN